MDVPLSVCESRDPKGLYKLARAGKIKGVTCQTRYLLEVRKKKQSIFFPLRKCFFIQVLLESMTLTRRHWIARLVMFIQWWFIQWCSWRTLCVDSKIFTIILCIFTGRAETHRRLLFATSDGWKHHLLLARQRLPWRLISQIWKIKEKKKTIRFCNG